MTPRVRPGLLLCICFFGLCMQSLHSVEYELMLLEEGSQSQKIERITGITNNPLENQKVTERVRKALGAKSTNKTVSTTTKRPATTATKLPKNNTEFLSNHTYYTSSYKKIQLQNSPYFKDLRILRGSNNTNVSLTLMKSNNIGAIKFFIKKLKFVFPFYGHDVSQVVVTSAGFLHVGPIVHNYAHDVHYIAPLMGNFSAKVNKTSSVYTYDDGDRFIAQWDSVVEAKENATEPFTFQVSIFKNGSIIFSYKRIPYSLSQLASSYLKPKVGLSDGYIYQYYIYVRGIRYGPLRVVFRYHTVSLPKEKVVSNSIYILRPILNCISAKSCNACFSEEIAQNFQCKWCSKLNLCSDSLDWHRQRWVRNGCPSNGVSKKALCNAPLKTTPTHASTTIFRYGTTPPKPGKGDKFQSKKDRKKSSAGIIIGVLVIIVILICVGVLFYGYRNPTSRIGMFMIEHRPAKLFGRI